MAAIKTAILAGFGFLFLMPTTSFAERRLALVIGNSNYDSVGRLKNPVHDVELIANVLDKLRFSVTQRIDLRQDEFQKAVTDFTKEIVTAKIADDNVIAVFYFAGHGVQFDDLNYLLPTDASADSQNSLMFDGIAADDVLRAFDRSGAKVNLIVLDACRDNPFGATTRSLSTRGLARMDAPRGSLIAYSTSPGQVARDGDGPNSPYAEALASALDLPGLTVQDIFERVRVQVVERTKEQTPWEQNSLTGDLVLQEELVPAESPILPANSPHRAFLVAVSANTIEAYDEFIRRFPTSDEAQQALELIEILSDENSWAEARRDDSIASYRLYVAKHRNGTHAVEAHLRLDQIKNDEEGWQAALTSGAYETYLAKHPTGRHVEEARENAEPASEAPVTPPAEPASPGTTEMFYYVTGLDPNGFNWLALREAPSLQAKWSATHMGPGTLLTKLGQEGEWYHVRLQSGEEGWANSRYIACCRADDSAPDSTPEQVALKSTAEFFRTWSQDNDTAMDFLGRIYSEEVEYFESVVPKSDVLEEKARFVERWPDRSYEIRPDASVSCTSENICSVGGVVDWRARSSARRSLSVGAASFELQFHVEGQTAALTAEKSKVLSRQIASE